MHRIIFILIFVAAGNWASGQPIAGREIKVTVQSVVKSAIPLATVSLLKSDTSLLRTNITDSTGTVIKQLSKKLKGAAVFQLDLSDRNQYPNKKSLRYLYSFSSEAVPNFKVGYGDIKVCDYNAGQEPVTVCFQ